MQPFQTAFMVCRGQTIYNCLNYLGVAATPPRFRESSLRSRPEGFNRITHSAGVGTNFGWIRSSLAFVVAPEIFGKHPK